MRLPSRLAAMTSGTVIFFACGAGAPPYWSVTFLLRPGRRRAGPGVSANRTAPSLRARSIPARERAAGMKPIPPGGVVPVMRLLLAIALIVSVGCVPAYHIDYIDFVKANGITYVGSGYVSTADEQVGRSLTDADLGPEQLRVRQRLAESGKAPDYRPIDGDAAFLAVDEPVYAVRGYAPTFP